MAVTRTDNAFFRPDIEGLRAVAILLVVGSHFAVPGFAAGFIGVDIFFVISGYLITSILFREYERTSTIRLGRFYANRLRRLLPALATVLVVTGLLALNLLPETRIMEFGKAAAAAAIWLSNIYFTFADIDYFGAESGSNPVLHTWSLGVEEQFYLFWPFAILLAVRLGKGQRALTLRRLLLLIAALSLVACLLVGKANPTFAFYMMPTRAWQFAAGALVWLVARQRVFQRRQATALAWLGVALVMAAMAIIGPSSTYPGWLALLPTLGTCALLWSGASAGGSRSQPMPVTFLTARPMQALGRVSYSWYLWHWPVLILGEQFTPIAGHPASAVFAIAISLAAAFATYHLVENPVRYGRMTQLRPGWQIGLALAAMVLINSQMLRLSSHSEEILASQATHPYASAIRDLPRIYADGCDDWYQSDALKPCVYGDRDAPRTVALMGDSIGAQWFSVLTEISDPDQWKIVVLTKSSCPMVDTPFFYQRIGREYTECASWRNHAIQWLNENHVDRVFIGGVASSGFTDDQWIDGTRRILDRLAPNIPAIYIIESSPALGFNGPDCLLKNMGSSSNPEKCAVPLEDKAYQHVSSLLRAAIDGYSNVHWIGTRDFVCPDQNCSARRGEMIVFRDNQHLTASFVAAAAPYFLQEVQKYERAMP